jgi:hypothetical protein
MIDWVYKGQIIKSLEDFQKNIFGFIYEITYSNGKKYLGSKYLFHNKTRPPLKGKKRKRKTVVESDWKTYIGSIKSDFAKKEIKEGEVEVVNRAILLMCENKKQISYYESKYLFVRSCIETDRYYNSNILGRYYKKDLM